MQPSEHEKKRGDGEQYFLNGKFQEAVSVFKDLLQEDPESPLLHFWYGASLLQSGAWEQCVNHLQKAHAADTTNTTVLNFLGAAKQNLQQHEEAVNLFEKVLRIQPENVAAKVNLAISLSQLGRHERALAMLLPFAEAGSAGPDILYNAALCSQKLRKYPQAQALYEQVLTLVPDNTDALINLGLVFRSQKKTEQAKNCFQKAMVHQPGNLDAHYNYASVLIDEEQFEEAEQIIVEVLKQEPDYLEAINDLGQIKFQNMQFADALQLFNRCLQLDRSWWHGLFNRALIYHESGLYTEAIADFREALLLEPENQLIHFGLAESLLSVGEFAEGYEHYEYRLAYDFLKSRKYPVPCWQGEDLHGKKIYIVEEQGSGDTFQFIRLLKDLKELGAYVIFECKAMHEKVLQSLTFIDTLCVGYSEQAAAECDYYISLLSLMHRLQYFGERVKPAAPYIQAPRDKAREAVAIVRAANNRKIGLVWSGNKFSMINRKRHCQLTDLLPVLRIPGIDFFSLQMDEAKAELQQLPEGIAITDLSSYIKDYADTAAILHELDCIISIDTSVAHLAGAMGKAVYLLLAKVPDWRWQGHDDTCDWYPGMRLFRQKVTGQWQPPVLELAETIAQNSMPLFTQSNPFVLALTSGENFGWGVCSKYIARHLNSTTPIKMYTAEDAFDYRNSTIFHAIRSIKLDKLYNVRGKYNIGYTFFEFLLDTDSRKNAAQYDLILGGSTWNKEKLQEAGISNADVLLQGIDPEVFYPIEDEKSSNLFVIFSGGKFELRKGQDIVLKAVGILQQRYKDVILINAWYNLWPQTMTDMARSSHIKFALRGTQWAEIMEYLYLINGMDRERIFTLGLTQNSQLRGIYAKTDIGLFPNRCEGGTNLVLMEYMACAKPVIASYNTGHKDVLTEDTSYMLKQMNPFPVFDEHGTLAAQWEEAELEEVVAALDYAYHHRDEIKATGKRAGSFMKNMTWEKTAREVLRFAEAVGRT